MGKGKKTGAAGTIAYIKRHWQLYVFFLLPALFLTLLFKYVPMGGILIAFMDYNPIQGILGSEWVGLEHFQRFLSSPDFMRYLMNTLKLSVYGLLWGFPVPIILAFLLNRIVSKRRKKKPSSNRRYGKFSRTATEKSDRSAFTRKKRDATLSLYR